jgi:methionyl-tRNA synthetase
MDTTKGFNIAPSKMVANRYGNAFRLVMILNTPSRRTSASRFASLGCPIHSRRGSVAAVDGLPSSRLTPFRHSAGIAVPRRIFSHGFLFNRGEKMSKSVGNVIDPFSLVKTYGVDPLRYFFLREVPFGQDGNYSHDAIINRINADLANDLGNLAQRSLTMVARNLDGMLPKPGALSDADNAILAAADVIIGKAREAMTTQQLHQVLNAVWTVVADANRYFAGEAPWALAKTDPARQGTVLYVTAEVLRQVAILAQPFVPASAGKLLDLLAIPADQRDFSFLGGKHRIAPGMKLPAPAPVFPRYVEAEAPAAQ